MNEDPTAEIRTQIALYKEMIQQERFRTIERLRGFDDQMQLRKRERQEWMAFHERTSCLQREIDAMIKLLTEYHVLQPLPPIVIKSHS